VKRRKDWRRKGEGKEGGEEVKRRKKRGMRREKEK